MYKQGDIVGELTLIEKIPYKIPCGRTKNKWKCLCSCGNETEVFASNLNKTRSCGHLKETTPKSFFVDLSGKTFGRLTVLYRTDDRISKSGRHLVRYMCKCLCGNFVEVDAQELRKGSTISCGCYQKETNSVTKCKIHVGDKFGKLTVAEKMPSKHYGRSTMSRWKCNCECGSSVIVFGGSLLRGQVSCGCVNSKGEEEIAEYLSRHDIQFIRQFYFDDLLSTKGFPIYFDFAIKDKDGNIFLLEYQGIQHYIPQQNHFGDYQRDITDVLKRKYCKEHNIDLVEIRYDENVSERLNEIFNIPMTTPCQDS